MLIHPTRKMKQSITCISTLVLLIMALPVLTGRVNAQADRKFALLIGIGNYPPEGGWQRINAPNDLFVMTDALQKRGFLPENIMILKDQYATREGILNVWRQSLLPRVQSGDVVYFQFSGHGQQVADDNGDELDGYDEAIVPYNSPLRYEAGVYQGENLIRDDELNNLFTDLRRRLGPAGNLMVVIDACHSGTGTRGMEPARGTDRPMASDEYVKSAAQRGSDGFAAPQYDDGSGAGVMAPMVAYFGSAQNQLNFETRDEQGQLIGSLTYALGKKLSQAPVNVSYRGLFEQIRTEMSAIAPRQQPQAEGMLDQELLGGRLLPKPAYWRVVRWDHPGAVGVDAGWVAGLNEGAVLGLFPPETRNPASATPLARGTVSAVLPFQATLTLDRELTQQAAKDAWVYVLEHNFGALQLGLSLQLPPGHPLRDQLANKLATYPMIRLDQAPDVYVVQSGNDIQIIARGDLLLESFSASMTPGVAAERVLRRILAYAQAKYLRQMEAQNPTLNVRFDLIPVQLDSRTLRETGELPIQNKLDAAGNLHFRVGDVFRVRVTNQGDKAAYFTLLDIQPDNVINVLIPPDGQTPAEFRVGPGQTVDVPRHFQIGPPSGVEMFKLIATEQPVDLRPIEVSRGTATRSNNNPLETLFGQTFFNEEVRTRGGKTVNLAAGSIHIQSFNFIID